LPALVGLVVKRLLLLRLVLELLDCLVSPTGCDGQGDDPIWRFSSTSNDSARERRFIARVASALLLVTVTAAPTR